MKFTLSLIALIFLSLSAQADYNDPFQDVSEEACPDRTFDKTNEILYCKAENSKEVLSAKIGGQFKSADLKKLGFFTYSAVDIGLVPDADSSTAYFYTRWLVNSAGKKVGVVTIEGWHNSEMESSARFDTTYNLKGQVVSIQILPIR